MTKLRVTRRTKRILASYTNRKIYRATLAGYPSCKADWYSFRRGQRKRARRDAQ